MPVTCDLLTCHNQWYLSKPSSAGSSIVTIATAIALVDIVTLFSRWHAVLERVGT